MKIYLDTCSLNRPLDDKSLARNALEATAVLAILAACEQARLTLISSNFLVFENEQNPHPQDAPLLLKCSTPHQRILPSLIRSPNAHSDS